MLNAKFPIIKSERLKIDVQDFLQESMYEYKSSEWFFKKFSSSSLYVFRTPFYFTVLNVTAQLLISDSEAEIALFKRRNSSEPRVT